MHKDVRKRRAWRRYPERGHARFRACGFQKSHTMSVPRNAGVAPATQAIAAISTKRRSREIKA
jgi:hypothetical protein